MPGGYYTSRNLDNAFRACVYRLENPREMLRYWTNETNKEIQRKLEEYHLGPQERPPRQDDKTERQKGMVERWLERNG